MTNPNHPAFGDTCQTGHAGLTVREYMATHALAWLLVAEPKRSLADTQEPWLAKVAGAAVILADALIEALNKPRLRVTEDDGTLE